MVASEKDGNSGEWRASSQAKPGEAKPRIILKLGGCSVIWHWINIMAANRTCAGRGSVVLLFNA